MKCRFSKAQRFPAIISIVGMMISFVFASFSVWYLRLHRITAMGQWMGLTFVWVLILSFGLVLYCKTSFSLRYVLLSKEGVSIVGRKGKKVRNIPWEKVALCTVTLESDENRRYICISSNPDLSRIRTVYFGVVWALFEDKRTITFPANSELVDYCNENLEKYNMFCTPAVHLNPNSPELKALQKKTMKKYWIILASFLAFEGLVLLAIWVLT